MKGTGVVSCTTSFLVQSKVVLYSQISKFDKDLLFTVPGQ